jgi:putative DNA primase/helicase
MARQADFDLPLLVGVVNCPSISLAGELLDTPGYDLRTGLLYDPRGVAFPPIPDKPTELDAEKAYRRIDKLLGGFPFASDEDKAVAISGILSFIERPQLPFVPAHAADAPNACSGKSYYVDLASTIATGRPAGVMVLGNPEEVEKRVDAQLLVGAQHIAFDNCTRAIDDQALCVLLTQERHEVRILGKSQIAKDTPVAAFVTFTGNNLVFEGDMPRRQLTMRLDPQEARPEFREFNFDALEDARENRGELVAAALTLIRAYIVANWPCKLKPLDGYAEWSRLVREPITWIGDVDPVLAMDRARDNDPVLSRLKSLALLWLEMDPQRRARLQLRRSSGRRRRDRGESSGRRFWRTPASARGTSASACSAIGLAIMRATESLKRRSR